MKDPESGLDSLVPKHAPWALKIVFMAILTVFLLGLVDFHAQLMAIQVLPGLNWVLRVRPFAIGLGIAEALGLFLLAVHFFESQGGPILGKHLLLIFGALPIGFLVAAGLLYTGPALVASTGQGVVGHVFVVDDVPRHDRRRCRNNVRLRDLPFLADEICGVPDGIRDQLEPGMRIEVIGTGNALGLRPGRIRILPQKTP